MASLRFSGTPDVQIQLFLAKFVTSAELNLNAGPFPSRIVFVRSRLRDLVD